MSLDRDLMSYPHHNRKGFTVIQTCGACPEQYDVYKGKRLVGYMRLRHGRFYVSAGDALGDILWESYPEGDGMFDSDEERNQHLDTAIEYIIKHMETQ